MKKMVTLIVFIFLVINTQAQNNDTKKILSTYEKIAKKYYDLRHTKEISNLTSAQLAFLKAKKMAMEANFEAIKRETTDKFYKDSVVNLQDIKAFIESNYRTSLKDLPEEFYKEVQQELK
jgi:hypothetical protein